MIMLSLLPPPLTLEFEFAVAVLNGFNILLLTSTRILCANSGILLQVVTAHIESNDGPEFMH